MLWTREGAQHVLQTSDCNQLLLELQLFQQSFGLLQVSGVKALGALVPFDVIRCRARFLDIMAVIRIPDSIYTFVLW